MLIRHDANKVGYNLGAAYENKGHCRCDIYAYQKSIELNPHDAEIHFNLGLTYRKKGIGEEAIREYEETIRLAPDFTEVCKTWLY